MGVGGGTSSERTALGELLEATLFKVRNTACGCCSDNAPSGCRLPLPPAAACCRQLPAPRCPALLTTTDASCRPQLLLRPYCCTSCLHSLQVAVAVVCLLVVNELAKSFLLRQE